MSTDQLTELYWDPFDTALNIDPYRLFRRLRDEAPLYYNEVHDFYVVTRHEDVERAFIDPTRLINGRTSVIDFIKLGVPVPSGMFIFEDPPLHAQHRGLLSRVFTPKSIAALEPQVRDFSARCLDEYQGSDGFDFVTDFGDLVAARTIGLMLGIPESQQLAVKGYIGRNRAEDGELKPKDEGRFGGAMFAEYVDWRAANPSDDLTTALLNVEFEDESGVTRKLTRAEILTFIDLLAGAGNDTTAKLIGWTGKILSDHPDQRAELVADPSLIRDAIEELLRYETPGMQNARWAVEDVEFSGGIVPSGSPVVCVMASANHDERKFPDPERFDIHRKPRGILSFAFGIHFCLGAALARLEGRIALEEILKRFPQWRVDDDRSVLRPTSTTRGYSNLPVLL